MARRPLVGQRPPLGLLTYAVGFGILYSLALSADVSAQLPLPPGANVPAPGSTATSETPRVATDQLIQHVRAAMSRKDYRNAVELFRHSAASLKQSPQMAPQVEQLRAELVSAGLDRELLSLPPSGPLPNLAAATEASSPSPLGSGSPGSGAIPPMGRLPSVAEAQPIGGPADIATRKQEALRLIAIGRASLDRGETSTALTLARQAQALNVPERAFSAGEPRVWQLLLDAESAARKSGIALTSGTSPSDDAANVKQAVGAAGDIDSAAVAQMLFNGDAVGNAQAGGTTAGDVSQVQNLQALPAGDAGESSYANTVYQEGLDLLLGGDQAAAREKFLEAWKHESTLDLETRRQLKDKLTLLQSNRIGGMTAAKEPEAPLTAIERAQLENQEKTRRLYRQVTSELAKANESKTTAPMDALDQLERLKRRVETSDLDESGKRSLTLMVDRALRDQQQYVAANRADIELELRNESIRTTMANEAQREAAIDDEIASLVQEFNQLIESRRFNEAEVIAKQVSELKPGSPIAITMLSNARMQVRGLMNQEIRDAKEESFFSNMLDVERAAIGINPERNFALPEARIWEDLSRRRLAGSGGDERLSVREQEIKRSLSTDVNVKYRNRPLHEVLEDLAAVTGVPIVMDSRSLSAVRVTPDTPVNLSLQQSIPLKSALSLILANLELTYVIENDVLNVTSLEAKRSKVFPKTYRVTDLVTPIPNFTSSYEDGLAGALRAAYQMS
ncbi:MAG: hypothetical protein ACF788_06410, partial [Novipirellula sp. JB048]